MRATVRMVTEALAACAAAFQFLTRIPVPVQLRFDETLCRRSIVFYPLAGAAIGALVVLSGQLLTAWLPPLPAAVLTLAIWVGFTGALHLDGLMDTADGLLSYRSRERMLDIMKDSRVGAMGVVVCVLHLLLKASLLHGLLESRGAGAMWLSVALVPMWSRWFMGLAVGCWPYARAESGLGAMFRGVGVRHMGAMSGAAVLLAAAVWVWTAASGHFAGAHTARLALLLMPIVAAAGGWLLARAMAAKLGGLTGDTYGALNELLELLLLLALVFLFCGANG